MSRRCSPKRRFRTEREADDALGAIWSQPSEAYGNGRLPCRIYLCQVCQTFHLTARPSELPAVGEVLSESTNPTR